MATDVNIEVLLRSLGFTSEEAIAAARGVLESAGLTRAGKRRIAGYKLEDVRRALDAALVRVCGVACSGIATAHGARTPVVVTPASSCEVCGGSNNKRAALAAAAALRTARVRRLLVVGGTPAQHTELRGLLEGDGLSLQFVDGMERSHSQRDAIANMRRSDLVVIWGSTPLRHAVSNLYTESPVEGVRTITVARRGIEALCREIVRAYAGKGR